MQHISTYMKNTAVEVFGGHISGPFLFYRHIHQLIHAPAYQTSDNTRKQNTRPIEHKIYIMLYIVTEKNCIAC